MTLFISGTDCSIIVVRILQKTLQTNKLFQQTFVYGDHIFTSRSHPGRGLAVNFCKKCGEMRWKKIIFTPYFLHLFTVNAVNRGELFIFTAISVFLQKRIVHTCSNLCPPARRWIIVRNAMNFAVNFCKKCGELWWNIYFHRIHRNHRMYKNSPHSLHFLQKITLKPRPGHYCFSAIRNDENRKKANSQRT